MLPANLITNEVKDASGAEVEFLHLERTGRKQVFAKSGENPSEEYRITVQHSESGKGTSRTRNSNVSVVKNVTSANVDGVVVPITVSVTCRIPVGHLDALTEVQNALANAMSFLATTGAGTTVLFNCTGYGAEALVNGSL